MIYKQIIKDKLPVLVSAENMEVYSRNLFLAISHGLLLDLDSIRKREQI